MKRLEFKRPFYKAATIQTLFLPFIALVYVILAYWEALKFWEWSNSEFITALIVAIFVGILGWCGVYRQLYFIEIYEDKLVLRNGILICDFISLSFNYCATCMIAYNKSSITHYIRFGKGGNRKWGRYFGIDLVDPKDLKEIISILESKGVTVITKDLKEI